MCGIVGFANATTSLGPWFGEAVDRARHRGPDGDGWWVPGMSGPEPLTTLVGERAGAASVAFGHLRLSIIDLSETGAQPMVVPGRAAITYNGEIYNYLELRRELEQQGHRFVGTSDTEVILAGWLAWGRDVFRRMNGMWAIALWDEPTRTLVLSRDRFGEKPLFVTEWRGGVAFSSEIKQLLAFPGVVAKPNLDHASRYLRTGRPYDGSSATFFDGIEQIPPATTVFYEPHGRSVWRYYDVAAASAARSLPTDPTAYDAAVAEALRRSVQLRMRSDVPVGGCLSAGIDSSVITLAASTQLDGEHAYSTFTLGSSDPVMDERGPAERFAAACGVRWVGAEAASDELASVWDRLIWHQEVPTPTTSLYGQWKILQRARAEGVIVMLDGQGADEIFAGYLKFLVAKVRRQMRTEPLRAPGSTLDVARFIAHTPKILSYGHDYLGRFARVPRPASWSLVHDSSGPTTPSLGSSRDMRLADISSWSLPNLLSYEDRNAMANSVETRLPFLDPDVVELALAADDDLLLRSGWSKYPLRSFLGDRGHPDVAWRRGKMQFFVPQSDWLRTDLAPMVDDLRHAPHPVWSQLIDTRRLQEFGDTWAQRRSRQTWDDVMFRLVALDRLLRRFFDC